MVTRQWGGKIDWLPLLAPQPPPRGIGNNEEDDDLTKIRKAFGRSDAPGQSYGSPQFQNDAYS